MKTITITVDVDGNSVSREFQSILPDDYSEEVWGSRVIDMLDTIAKSEAIKP